MSSSDPAAMRETVPLTTYFFDLLHLDGQDLVDEPAAARWQLLSEVAPARVVPRLVTSDAAKAQTYFDERIAAGHEGVVVKVPQRSDDRRVGKECARTGRTRVAA